MSGVCPACRWDAAEASQEISTPADVDEGSFAERYRGTEYHQLATGIQEVHQGPERTRLLVGAGLDR